MPTVLKFEFFFFSFFRYSFLHLVLKYYNTAGLFLLTFYICLQIIHILKEQILQFNYCYSTGNNLTCKTTDYKSPQISYVSSFQLHS